jgi:hypothetical protein
MGLPLEMWLTNFLQNVNFLLGALIFFAIFEIHLKTNLDQGLVDEMPRMPV